MGLRLGAELAGPHTTVLVRHEPLHPWCSLRLCTISAAAAAALCLRQGPHTRDAQQHFPGRQAPQSSPHHVLSALQESAGLLVRLARVLLRLGCWGPFQAGQGVSASAHSGHSVFVLLCACVAAEM